VPWLPAQPLISVIVPSYNSAPTIGRTLEALLAQQGPPREIIVVDSSDDDRTRGILTSFESRGVRVTRLAEKTMPAVGRNLGAGEASGKVLAFIDSDAYPAPDWLERIASATAQGCRVGGGSLKVPGSQRNRPIALAQYFLQFSEFLDTGSRRVKTFVPSVNLFCEKSLFDELGGFPRIRASEDVLFGFEAGKRSPVYFEPSIKVFHVFREDLGAYLTNQLMLGKYVQMHRRRVYRSFLYTGVTAVLLLPAFMLLKLLRIVWRILMTLDLGEMWRFLASFPLFLLGLGYWGAGFVQGCLNAKGAGE
jgi:glycosyltransferase involved in cell wall biosynthesis